MSNAPRVVVASAEYNKVGPDYVGYYLHEVTELLFQDEDLPSSSQTTGLSQGKCEEVKEKETNGYSDSGSYFSNSIGAGLSDFKQERLKALLKQSVIDLTAEVDEMLDSAVAMRHLRQLIGQKPLSSNVNVASDGDAGHVPPKKLKTSSSLSSRSVLEHSSPVTSRACEELDVDLKFLLENDRHQVGEMLKKHSDELSATVGHMERQIEKLLDAVAAKCRPMTFTEKQKLTNLIQKLPSRNLDHVAEIIQCHKPSRNECCNEVFVDLEEEDNATLWRLYFYVKAVEKARKLMQ